MSFYIEQEFIWIQVQNALIHSTKDEGKFVTYDVELKTNSLSFTNKHSIVRRRYNDFLWLQKALRQTTGKCTEPLHRKRIFGKYKESNLKKNEKLLTEFLQTIVKDALCVSSAPLHLFLQTSLDIKEMNALFCDPCRRGSMNAIVQANSLISSKKLSGRFDDKKKKVINLWTFSDDKDFLDEKNFDNTDKDTNSSEWDSDLNYAPYEGSNKNREDYFEDNFIEQPLADWVLVEYKNVTFLCSTGDNGSTLKESQQKTCTNISWNIQRLQNKTSVSTLSSYSSVSSIDTEDDACLKENVQLLMKTKQLRNDEMDVACCSHVFDSGQQNEDRSSTFDGFCSIAGLHCSFDKNTADNFSKKLLTKIHRNQCFLNFSYKGNQIFKTSKMNPASKTITNSRVSSSKTKVDNKTKIASNSLESIDSSPGSDRRNVKIQNAKELQIHTTSQLKIDVKEKPILSTNNRSQLQNEILVIPSKCEIDGKEIKSLFKHEAITCIEESSNNLPRKEFQEKKDDLNNDRIIPRTNVLVEKVMAKCKNENQVVCSLFNFENQETVTDKKRLKECDKLRTEVKDVINFLCVSVSDKLTNSSDQQLTF